MIAVSSKSQSDIKKNVLLLATCQALFSTSTGVLLSVAALVGYKLAGDKSLATLPQALQWLSTAAFAIPVAVMMRRIGRGNAFTISAFFGIAGALVAAASIFQNSFSMFMVATIIFGGFTAASQHYRFAAAETAAGTIPARDRCVSVLALRLIVSVRLAGDEGEDPLAYA